MSQKVIARTTSEGLAVKGELLCQSHALYFFQVSAVITPATKSRVIVVNQLLAKINKTAQKGCFVKTSRKDKRPLNPSGNRLRRRKGGGEVIVQR